MISARFTARNVKSAAKEDTSARSFTLPIGTSVADIANIRIAAIQGVPRLDRSVAKAVGISPCRPIENASREVAISVMRTVFAVENNALTLSKFAAPGQTF